MYNVFLIGDLSQNSCYKSTIFWENNSTRSDKNRIFACIFRLFSKNEEADREYLESASGLIIGSPTYLAASVWQIRKWLEEDSLKINLSGKLGGAFATAHYAQGGQDTAIMDMLGQLLVKGMLIYSGGGSYGLPIIHHGPVALDKEGNHYEESREMFRIYGNRFASKAIELFG